MSENDWIKKLEELRREKDIFFKTHPESPIPPEDRGKFKGLSYFPINPKFRFILELREHPDKKVIHVEDTAGQIRSFLRWGEFVFTIDGKEYRLQAYTNDPKKGEVFVPFKDLTNGKETYGAGRYIDLYYDKDTTADGKWILDFNQAYNPWCAYSTRYACPFIPPENWLNVQITAGEKNYQKP
ncbi:MAG: DUF1684 domain-containing protein [Candidatus Aenigmarchaeota archaeon]|nr:DUF1684 domain-containing protein [Candidatus Aenigmarchaeota archaeon]